MEKRCIICFFIFKVSMQQHKCQLILENDELERRDRDRFDCERIARNDLITSSSHFFYQNIRTISFRKMEESDRKIINNKYSSRYKKKKKNS